jgi:hypothetical protein
MGYNKSLYHKILRKSVLWESNLNMQTDTQTDVRTDMTRPEGTLHDYANTPKQHKS